MACSHTATPWNWIRCDIPLIKGHIQSNGMLDRGVSGTCRHTCDADANAADILPCFPSIVFLLVLVFPNCGYAVQNNPLKHCRECRPVRQLADSMQGTLTVQGRPYKHLLCACSSSLVETSNERRRGVVAREQQVQACKRHVFPALQR